MVLPRGGGGGRGGYHSRGGTSRGGIRSYHGSGSYHSSHHNSSYDNRNDSRNNRYGSSNAGGAGGAGGGGGGGAYDSRNSSRYESESRYSRHDSRNDNYKRANSSKYEDNRDRRSPDRKRPRNEHNSQGGSSRRDYGGSSSVVGGRGGGSSSSRYHEGGNSGSSYDKRGSHDHHSSTAAGTGDSSSGRSKFDPHHRSSSSGNRSHGGGDSGSSYRSRDNNSSSMGPPRSVAMRTSGSSGGGTGNGRSMLRPPMGGSSRMLGGIGGGSSSSLGGGMGGGMHRRGSGSMRGRISHYRSDGRRGMLNSRILGGAHHRRNDMRPMSMHNRRFPSIRGRGDMRHRIIGGNIGSKRPHEVNTKVSRKALIKRAIQAAKDVHEESPSDNEDDDDEEDEGVDDELEALPPKKMKRATEESSADVKPKKEDTGDDKHQENSSAKIKREEEEDEEDDADTTGAMVEGEDELSKLQTPIKMNKIPKKESASCEKSDENRKDDGNDKKRSTKINTKYRSSSFIKLTCTHCNLKCVTFKEYQTHLYSRGHKLKMRSLAVKCRERLLEMRAAQRNAQKDEDEKSEDGADGDEGGGKPRAGFCMLCRLNYRQPRATHHQSEGHKQMKNFLMPYCSVCRIGFKSPMAFETHRASLDHLKIKARVERYSSKGDDSGDELTGDLVDLNSLTIVDEVGKVDEICEPGSEKEAAGSTSAGPRKREYHGRTGTDDEDDDDDEEDEDDEDLQMIIGEEYVKKVEVQYCELCDMYLHRRLDTQKTLREHCKKPAHLRLYIAFRNDKKLREQAERIHKKKLKGDKEAANAKKGDEKKPKESGAGSDSKSAATAASDNATTNTGSTAATTSAAASGGDGGTATEANPNESSVNCKSALSKGCTATVVSTGASQPLATGEDPATTVSTEESLSLDASKDADTTSLGGDVNAALIDDKLMWVDNDELGDLLRDVDEAEEEDDDKASLERYDKFRHTEKNGLEVLVTGADGDEEDDSADIGGDNKSSSQVKTTTNGDTASVDAGKDAKVVDA